MMSRIALSGFVVCASLLTAGLLAVRPVKANIRPLVVSKSMYNTSLAGKTNANQLATVTTQDDIIQVTILVTNPEDKITSGVKFRDEFAETGKTLKDLTGIKVYEGGLKSDGSCDDTSLPKWSFIAPVGNEAIFTIGGAVPNELKAKHQYCIQYSGKAKPDAFPTYKSRLVGYPVYVQDFNMTFDTMYDITYLYYVPNTAAVTKQISSSLYYSGPSNLDLGLIIPGASVTVTTGNVKTVTTPSTLALYPNQNTLATAGDAVTPGKQCQLTLNPPYQKSRGGACLFTTTATVSDGGVELGSARASFLALPSSSIIGNVYAGSGGLTADKLLLPGQHTAGSSTSHVALSKENIAYSIDNNAVSGWDPVSVYKNVYQNVNVQRLVRNPDWVINAANCNNGTYPHVTCSSSGGEENIKYSLDSGVNFNLSKSTLDGPPLKPRKDGYVVYVDGNLTIENSPYDNSHDLRNYISGTIIVNGRLIIHNANITSPIDLPSVPLGFIVLGTDGSTTAALWNSDFGNDNRRLESVAFFVPKGTFKAVKTGATTLKLVGSIAANQVDLSDVAPAGNVAGSATDAADQSGITIISDPTIAASPPPGFQLFSSSPVLKDLAP